MSAENTPTSPQSPEPAAPVEAAPDPLAPAEATPDPAALDAPAETASLSETAPAAAPAPRSRRRRRSRRAPLPLEWDAARNRLAQSVPRTRSGILKYVYDHFRIRVPDQPVCPNHQSPADYLCASFLDQRDLLVWANRGGGKTFIAALATLMDALCHGPMKISVLGGSFDQSDRLADYIRDLVAAFPHLAVGRMTRERVKLVSGSTIQMLAQSQTAVRGQHVQKIRCDEVDLFDSDVWRAVQFITRSQADARGSIEVLSTLHRSGGLMQKLVDNARSADVMPGGYRLIQWCLWEVIERCPASRKCRACPLADDCRGVAKRASGFFKIDDAIAIRARSSRNAWEAEMLCKGARRDWLVFGEFDAGRHVSPVEYDAAFPLYRAIDFGYRSPLVCLWVQVTPGGAVHVLDEYVSSRHAMDHHAMEIRKRDHGPVAATFVDPAGRQKESTSGAACTDILAQHDIACTSRPSAIVDGLELIRCALAPASGEPALRIHPRCTRLIEAFENYHYPPPESSLDPDKPVKDGPDHLLDALRYFFVNRLRPSAGVRRGTY